MKKLLYGIAILKLATVQLFAQDVNTVINKNTFFFEVGGKGLFYSLNYDRILFAKKELKLSARVGSGFASIENKEGFYSLPVGFNVLLGNDLHHFELGYGLTYLYAYDNKIYNDFSSGQYIYDSNRGTYNYIAGNYNSYSGSKNGYLMNNLSFGYRRQPKEGGLFFSAFVMFWIAPIKLHESGVRNTTSFSIVTNKITPFAGLGIGYSF